VPPFGLEPVSPRPQTKGPRQKSPFWRKNAPRPPPQGKRAVGPPGAKTFPLQPPLSGPPTPLPPPPPRKMNSLLGPLALFRLSLGGFFFRMRKSGAPPVLTNILVGFFFPHPCPPAPTARPRARVYISGFFSPRLFWRENCRGGGFRPPPPFFATILFLGFGFLPPLPGINLWPNGFWKTEKYFPLWGPPAPPLFFLPGNPLRRFPGPPPVFPPPPPPGLGGEDPLLALLKQNR